MIYINTIVGGGIVTLPFALASVGISLGIGIHLIVIALMMVTVHMCLKAKDNLGYESYSELAYLCFGRPSVFIINGLICFCVSGIVVLYMILFTRIVISLIPTSSLSDLEFIQVIGLKEFSIVILCILLIPFLIKKRLAELKFASYLQIIGIISLILIFIFNAVNKSSKAEETKMKELTMEGVLDCLNIVLTSYGFTLNFYPVYS